MAEKKQFKISEDYKEVAERIDDLYEKYPNAVLRGSWELQVMGEFAYIVYTAECWREPGDPLPSIGTAMEQIPGATTYTKGSEIQNAETSAWGRAIVAAGASRSKRIASADEIRSAEARRSVDSEPAPAEWIERVEATLNGIPDKMLRAATKKGFVQAFAPPRELRKSQMADVEAVLVQNKIPILKSTPEPAATDGGARSSEASTDGENAPEKPRAPGAQSKDEPSGSDAGEAGAEVGSSGAAPPASTPAKPSTSQQRQTLGIRFKDLEANEFITAGAKDKIVASLTLGRTTTRTELTFEEAVKLIALTHQIQAGNISVILDPGVALLTPNNPIGDKFMESWPNIEVPA